MRKEIYIVTDGTYSDYHIEAVFSSKKQALIYCATHCGEDGEVSEYTLDEHKFNTKKEPYSVWEGHFFTSNFSSHDKPLAISNVYKNGYSLKEIYEVTKIRDDDITIKITLGSDISENKAEKILRDLYAQWKSQTIEEKGTQ